MRKCMRPGSNLGHSGQRSAGKTIKQITTTQARNRTLYREVQGAHEAQRFIKRVEATSAVKRHASAVKQMKANGYAMQALMWIHAGQNPSANTASCRRWLGRWFSPSSSLRRWRYSDVHHKNFQKRTYDTSFESLSHEEYESMINLA